MAEFATAAGAPAASAVIYSMGFDHDMVQPALAQAGGNQQLAINLILNGEVHDVATASSSALSFAPAEADSCSSPNGGDDDDDDVDGSSSSSMLPNLLSFPDRLTGRRESLALVADGKLQTPAHLYAHIMA
jgi:hypothetical protein